VLRRKLEDLEEKQRIFKGTQNRVAAKLKSIKYLPRLANRYFKEARTQKVGAAAVSGRAKTIAHKE